MPFSLLIVDPEGTARRWPVGASPIRVGRGQANDLVIVGRGVSRLHVVLTPEGDTLGVEDQDSTYGTKVNGRQIRKASVGLGDHIDIGVFRLVLVPEMDRIEDPFGAERGQERRPREDGQVMTRWDEPTIGVAVTSEFQVSRPYGYGAERLSTAVLTTEDTSGIRRLLEAQESSDPYLGVRLAGALESHQGISRGAGSEPSLGARLEGLARALSQSTTGRGGAADLAAVLLVYRTAEKLTRAADLGTFLNESLDSLVKDLAAHLVALVRVDEVGKLQVVGIRPQTAARTGKDVPVSRAIIDQALRTGRPVQIRDTSKDVQFGRRDSILASRLGALLAVPLFVGDRTESVICLSRRVGQPFDDAETEAVMGVAGLLGRALSLRDLDVRAREETRRRLLLERFHSPEVVEQLYDETSDKGLREQVATAMYLELSHFEGFIERSGVAVAAELAEAFRFLAQGAVFNNGGTLVWLNEDSGLALFGGQGTAESDAAWALAAATEMLRGFASLARERDLHPKTALRIGLDRGPLMVGFLGPTERPQMAALGATVTSARDAARAGAANAIHATSRVVAQVPNPRGVVKELEPGVTGLSHILYEITL